MCALCLVLPEWAFGRDSWIHYEPRSTRSARSTRVRLMVRTRISRSTLLSLASADGSGYMRLEVGAPKALLLQSSSFVMEYPNGRRRCSFWLRTPIYNVMKSKNSPHEGSCSYFCCENKAQPEDCFVLLACSLCFYLSLAIKTLSTSLFLLKKKKKKRAVWIILARQRLIITIVRAESAGKTGMGISREKTGKKIHLS